MGARGTTTSSRPTEPPEMQLRWREGLLTFRNGIVGSVERHFAREDVWYAFGMLEDWQDTRLGEYATEAEARRAVEEWVRDRAAEEGEE